MLAMATVKKYLTALFYAIKYKIAGILRQKPIRPIFWICHIALLSTKIFHRMHR